MTAFIEYLMPIAPFIVLASGAFFFMSGRTKTGIFQLILSGVVLIIGPFMTEQLAPKLVVSETPVEVSEVDIARGGFLSPSFSMLTTSGGTFTVAGIVDLPSDAQVTLAQFQNNTQALCITEDGERRCLSR